jgi:hypothetical protein
MMSASLIERTALDALESGWRRRGYTLVREPSAEQLPEFLRGVRPDAIAIGAAPSLAIEVFRRRSPGADDRVERLRDLFADHPDWRLEVVYATPHGAPLKAVNPGDIRAALAEARRLAGGEPRGALLLAWASLEAIGRRLETELGSRSLAAGALIDLLVSNGHVDQVDGEHLRRLAVARDALAHGQLDLTPAGEDVVWLIQLATALNERNDADTI